MIDMKKLIATVGLTVAVVLAGTAIFANANQDKVIEEGVLGVQDTGKTLEVVKPTQQTKSEDKVNKTKSKLTMEEAIAIARKHATGTVKEAELEKDDGRLYYDIEIRDGQYEYEIEIDAYTGEVLDFEQEYDD